MKLKNAMKKNITIKLLMASFFLSVVLSSHVQGVSIPVVTPLDTFKNLLRGPTRLTTDERGRIYVTDSLSNCFYIYSNNGILLKTIEIHRPLGIATHNGKIFIGEQSSGSVKVFDTEGNLLYEIGSGAAEFGLPNDIAISQDGRVYIVDSLQNLVKVYSEEGQYLFNFGTGMSFPTGIAIDGIAGEIYVSDHNNTRIKVFDLNGTYKREIRGSGMLGSRFLRPHGLAMDSQRLYIVDSYNSTMAVYDKNGTFLGYVGQYGSEPGEFKIPLDAVFDRDGKLFVTNYNNSRIDVIGIDSFTRLNINPEMFNVEVYEGGEPVSFQVELSSILETISWTAESSVSWLSVTADSFNTPSTATITVYPYELRKGIYRGEVSFFSPNGVETLLVVNVNVKEAVLSVKPDVINMLYQKGSSSLPSQDLYITATGRELRWTAQVSERWVTLSSESGTTPSTVKLSPKPYVRGFSPGEYAATVTVDAGEVSGSPANVQVRLKILYAGTIKVLSNIEQASFVIKGPDGYYGSGLTWKTDEAIPGKYLLIFNPVPGYLKPHDRIFHVVSGKETVIEANYIPIPPMSHLVVSGYDGFVPHISVLTADGNVVYVLSPSGISEVKHLAAGDMDGDGYDEIVFSAGNRIYILTVDGSLKAYYNPPKNSGIIDFLFYDLNRDGKREFLIGYINGSSRKIVVLEKSGVVALFNEPYGEHFEFSTGDFNGDGIGEFIIVDRNGLRIRKPMWNFFIKSAPLHPKNGLPYLRREFSELPGISTSDLNGDGIDEVVLKDGDMIRILDNELNTLTSFKPFENADSDDLKIIAGDIDGDGVGEIVVAKGNEQGTVIKIFRPDGYLINEINLNYKGPVHIGLGRFRVR